jgi:hypothetical protein
MVTAARAANQQTIDSTGGVCFDPSPSDQGPALKIVIACHSSSSNSVLVNIEIMHGANEFFEIEPGQAQGFQLSAASGYGAVTVKGSGGDAVIGWAVFG